MGYILKVAFINFVKLLLAAYRYKVIFSKGGSYGCIAIAQIRNR